MYLETADIETSSEDYARRFTGHVGAWLLSVQSNIVLKILASLGSSQSVLDVGGGHGQLAATFIKAGCNVTVIGSSSECETKIKPLVESGQCSFIEGDLISLPFPDKSFDVVTCFRFLSHCTRWEKCIGELCRVSKTMVIADFPSSRSLNILTPWLFKAKRKIEGNTRTYTLFSPSQIEASFLNNDFKIESSHKQFFFPMVFHRSFKNVVFSRILENLSSCFGLTYLFGSPVIITAMPLRKSTISNV